MKNLSILKGLSFLFAIGLAISLTQPGFSQEVVPEDEKTKNFSEKPFSSREKLNDTLLESIVGEDERVQTFIDNLSNDQVFALNRSSNNALKNGLKVDFELDLLEKIVEKDYDKRQINALTKGLEKEASFLAKYEKTGDPKFREKAEREKEKFLAKIDKFEGEDVSEEVKRNKIYNREAKLAAKETRKATRNVAKETRNAARDVAKEARNAARDVAKEARNEAREAVKENAKDARKSAKK